MWPVWIVSLSCLKLLYFWSCPVFSDGWRVYLPRILWWKATIRWNKAHYKLFNLSPSSKHADGTDSLDTLNICLYWSLLLVGSLDGTQCSHIAWEMFLLEVNSDISLANVVWVGPCFSSSAQHVLFILDGLQTIQDGRKVAIQLLFCRVLIPGFDPNSMQYHCVVPI